MYVNSTQINNKFRTEVKFKIKLTHRSFQNTYSEDLKNLTNANYVDQHSDLNRSMISQISVVPSISNNSYLSSNYMKKSII